MNVTETTTVRKSYDPDIEALLGPSKDMAMGGAYEGASTRSRELALYQPPLRSANVDIGESKRMADGRARDMARNDAFVQSGSAIHKDSIVGSAFLLNAKPEQGYLARQDSRFDEKWEEEFQEEVEVAFGLYAESNECFLDAARGMTLTEMVRLTVGTCFYGGESLWTAEWERTDRSRPFQTMFQCVEVDRLSTPPDKVGDSHVVAGVEQGPYGQATGYHIQKGHPTDWLNPNTYSWKYVPARKPWGRLQVLHVKETTRPDQTRAVSDLVAAMSELKSVRDFRKVLLQNAIVNASYAASIESELPTEMVMQTIGQRGATDASAATLDWAGQYLAAIAQYTGDANHIAIDGVKLPHLFPGTKLQLRPMGTPGGVGTDFESSLLRYLAAAIGTSYEELTRDYSKSNYSSIKAALSKTGQLMQSKKKIIADRAATAFYACWLEEALNKGLIFSMPRNAYRAANFYDGLNKQAYTSCEWIGAGRGQIDELKESQAAVLRLKSNLTTLEQEHARFGRDWRKELKQMRREKAKIEEYGLQPELDDNMINAASGSPREKGDGEAADVE